MRILWPHNFDPQKQNAGVFMHQTADCLNASGIEVHPEYLGNLRSLQQLTRSIKHLKSVSKGFDIVHAQFGSACGFVTSFLSGVPKVLTIRGSDWNTYNDKFGFAFLHTRLAHVFTNASITKYDKVIIVSDRLAKQISKKHPNVDYVVLPSPVDLNRFVPGEKAKLREKLGYPGNNEKWVLFNSTDLYKPSKRFVLAKATIDVLQRQRKDIRFRIANNIPHTDIPLFIASCDVILCTSSAEGWPNSVKEALACNVPFVSTDVSDLADIAAKESSCRICPPDPILLADAMREVLSMPVDYDLRQHVREMDMENTCRKTFHIYDQLLRK